MGDVKPFERSGLANLLAEDKLRAQQDDAKKRAVGQLADYDSFKNMVATAHLTPMDTKEVDALRGFSGKVKAEENAPAWTFGVDKGEDATAAVAGAIAIKAQEALGQVEEGAPATKDEFERGWRARKGDADARIAFAASVPDEDAWASLFKVEMSSVLLGEIADAALAAADRGAALRALAGAARGGRFMLAAAALGRARKAALAELAAAAPAAHAAAAAAVARAYR